ncbi:MAG TPA: dihydrodipicolinate synthase family protein [Caulobacteraceae bacterium]|nr:dihydrodipicolinate synthase family protein [Caulobacteraceae bacterium]
MPPEPFARINAAITTPFFGEELAVDHRRLAAHATWLLGAGCDGLVLFGTTGEAASLALSERKQTLERLIADGVEPRRVLVGAGCCSVAETAELMIHAAGLGCAGALVVPPYFYKGVSRSGVSTWFSEVIEACGAGAPRIWLYHIPQASGVPIGPDLVGDLLAAHGELIAGYKDSAGDFANTAEILRRFPRLEVFVGSESQLLEAWRAGGAGCISATTNVQPGPARRLFEAWKCGDGAAEQAKVAAARAAIERAGPMIAATKAMVGVIHRDGAWRAPRPPLEPLADAARRDLRSKLAEIGVERL